MSKFLKLSVILFTLMQTVNAGRMYDPEVGRFVSRDPLGYVDGMSLYNGYFAERFELDPTGHNKLPGIHVKTTEPFTPGLCAKFSVTVEYSLTAPSINGGWIIQRIESEADIKTCDDRDIGSTHKFDEGWHVSKGKKRADSQQGKMFRIFGRDTWAYNAEHNCTKGSITIKSEVRYVDGLNPKLPKPWSLHEPKTHPTGGLHATPVGSPPFISPKGTSDGPVLKRALKVKWNCCDKTENTTTELVYDFEGRGY